MHAPLQNTIDGFKARARAMREGLEPELAVAINVMYPMDAVTQAASRSRRKYPHTALRLYVEAWVESSNRCWPSCSIGVIGSLPLVPGGTASEPLLDILCHGS